MLIYLYTEGVSSLVLYIRSYNVVIGSISFESGTFDCCKFGRVYLQYYTIISSRTRDKAEYIIQEKAEESQATN